MKINQAYKEAHTPENDDSTILTPAHAEALKQAGHPLLASHILYELSLIEKGVAERIDTLSQARPLRDYDGVVGALSFTFDVVTGRKNKDDAAYDAYEDYITPIRLARESFGFDPWIPHIDYLDRPEDILISIEADPAVQKILNAVPAPAPVARVTKAQSPGQQL